MEQLFLDRLSPAARRDTLLILTADHGQIPTRPDPHYDLRNHPGLMRRLHINPTGENRLAYLYIRPGQSEAVREYVERTWPNQFAVVESSYAAEMGLFGPGQPHPALQDRIGDYPGHCARGGLLLVGEQGRSDVWPAWRPAPGRDAGAIPGCALVSYRSV